MATKTKSEADYVATRMMSIIKKNGGALGNIEDNLSYEINRFGEYDIIAESNTGSTHTSRMRISVKPDPSKPGATVDFQPGLGCNSSEAQMLEEKVMKAYFSNHGEVL